MKILNRKKFPDGRRKIIFLGLPIFTYVKKN